MTVCVWRTFMFCVCLQSWHQSRAEPLPEPPLYLTVSSLFREDDTKGSGSLTDRELQIHFDPSLFDRVVLYHENPAVNSNAPVAKFETELHRSGFIETNVSLENPRFPAGWDLDSAGLGVPGEHCLRFWVAGYQGGSLIHVNCLKIRPTWMHDNRISLGRLHLNTVFLPGTHNSGSYKRGKRISQSDVTTASRYLLTQDQPLWSQLIYGIRYFDFRVGYYPLKGNTSDEHCFWINHDLVKIRLLSPMLDELSKFLEKTRDEIVIIDFHRFPIGFSKRKHRHEALVSHLQDKFARYIIPYSAHESSLEKIFEGPGRLVISYGDNSIVSEYDWLWPPVKQVWGNKQTVSELESFLTQSIANDTIVRGGLWAAMAQLTPGPMDLLFNPKGSLREMAHRVNRNLSEWIRRDQWWPRLNVFAADFFLETNLIETAISANVQKGGQSNKYLTAS